MSEFIQRYSQANPNNTWEQMKIQLSVRFSDVMDAQMALSLLWQTRQTKGRLSIIMLKEFCLWPKMPIMIKEEMPLKGS